MEALQYMYTSWREFGYNVFKRSAGITDQDLPLIFKGIKYVAPTDLPLTSESDELERLYPVNFTSFKVNDKTCIARVNYLGKDDSGRFGNYFAHALLFSEACDFYPIDLAFEEIWKKRLTDEERQMDKGPHDIEPLFQLPYGKGMSYDELSTFMEVQGEDKYQKLINAFLYAKSSKRKLVIYDTQENIPMWLGLLTHSFPLSIARDITFLTYVGDFLQSQTDIFTIPPTGCSFNYEAEIKNGRMVVLDFLHEAYSPNITETQIAEYLSLGWAYSQDSINEFFEFIECLTNMPEFKDLASLGDLFLALRNGEIHDDQYEELIHQAEVLGQPFIIAQMCDVLYSALDNDEKTLNESDRLCSIVFLVKHEKTRSGSVCSIANDYLVEKMGMCDNSELNRILSAILDGEKGKSILQYSADPIIENAIVSKANQASPTTCSRYVCYILECEYSTSHHPDILGNDAIISLLQKMGQSDLSILNLAATRLMTDPYQYSGLIVCVCKALGIQYATNLVKAAFQTNSKEWQQKTTSYLSSNPVSAPVVMHLLYDMPLKPKERRESFWNLYNQQKSRGTSQDLLCQYLFDYIQHINSNDMASEAIDILDHVSPDYMDSRVLSSLASILDQCEYRQLVGNDKGQINSLVNAIQGKRISFPKGSLFIFCQVNNLSKQRELGTKLSAALRATGLRCEVLEKKEYEVLMKQLMPILLPWLLDSEDLIALGEVTYRSKGMNAMADEFIDQLHIMAKHLEKYYSAVMCPLVYKVTYPNSTLALQVLDKPLVAFYSKMNENVLNDMLRSARLITIDKTTNPFLKEVTERRENSFGNKMRSLFGKK